jgi:rod shape-determining protein MreC
MALAGGAMNRPSARDLAPGPRFFMFAIVSLVLMYFDQKDGWGDRIRYGLQAAAYPLQVAIGSPRLLWMTSSEFFRERGELRAENEALREQTRELSVRAMRMDALEQENARLRALEVAPPPLVRKRQLVNVVNADLGLVRQRLVIDQGARGGLYRSQVLIDADGLMGQLARVGPWSSEVMLISDPGAGVPVEVVRSGVRTIAIGSGNENEIELPLLPATADVKAGDLLVTSGLGSVFPAGIPVGTVTESRRDPDELLAFVRARPAAKLAGSRQLLALWFDPRNAAAPVDPKLAASLPEAPIAEPATAPAAAAADAAAVPNAPSPAPAAVPSAPSPAPTAAPDADSPRPAATKPVAPPARPGPR